MSFLDKIFPSSPAQTAPAASTVSPQTAQAAQVAPITMPSSDPTTATSTAPAAPPVDQFATLWDTDPNAVDPTNFSNGLNFNVTPEQLAAVADKLDFSSVVPNSIYDRINAGGEDAKAASMEMQNLIARAVYQQNALGTIKLVETATQRAQQGMSAMIDQKFKMLGLADTTATQNPALTNPAVKPLVDMIQQKIVQKFPNATSAEIAAKTTEYFNQVGSAFNPTASQAAAQASQQPRVGLALPEDKGTDWAEYLFS